MLCRIQAPRVGAELVLLFGMRCLGTSISDAACAHAAALSEVAQGVKRHGPVHELGDNKVMQCMCHRDLHCFMLNDH